MIIEHFGQIDWVSLFRFSMPMIVVFATAAVIVAGAALGDDDASLVYPVLALLGLAISFALAWHLWPMAGKGSALELLSFDRVALLGWMIVLVAAACTIALSVPYLSAQGYVRPEYYGLILFATFGMGVLAAAADLITILLGLETTSVSIYALTGFLRGRPLGVEAALKYFVMGAFATAFYVMGVAFLFGSTGITELGLLAARAGEMSSAGDIGSFFMFGVAMAAIGFAFKVAAAPFHAWLPDAYDGAPTPITAFMAAGAKAAAVLAFLRFSTAVAGAAGVAWHHAMWALSLATMLVGNLAALRQKNVKRMLAYSCIAHAGYLLVAFPSVAADSYAATKAVAFYVIAYALMALGAFAVVMALGSDHNEPVDVGHLAGLSRRRPYIAALFALFLVSLAGFPPTLGFVGKYYLFLAAVKNGDIWLVVAAAMNSVVAAYYYLRPVAAMYFRERKDGLAGYTAEGAAILSPPVVAVLVICAMAVVVFGLFPGNLMALVHASAPFNVP